MTEQLRNSLGVSSDTADTFMLYVGSAGNGGIDGTICRLCPRSAAPFFGLDQAILQMSSWMDELGSYSGTDSMRMFHMKREPHLHIAAEEEESLIRSGSDQPEIHAPRYTGKERRGAARKKESFLVRVICRQHTSWQGEICWRNQRIYFRSCLELIFLIHSVINGARSEGAEAVSPKTRNERKNAAVAVS